MMSFSNMNSFLFQYLFKNTRVQRAWKPSRSVALSLQSYSSQANEIVIPNAIPRGPTDILEALASTIKRDPTAPHYKFHDDPYLIPSSNFAKRSYALAQEAGRKAAIWVKQEHSDLFQHRNAEPFIEAFAPVEQLTEKTLITEELLEKYISSCQVANAIQVYGKLDKTTISAKTKQSFLELISFYNEEDQLNEDLIEERWFKSGMQGRDQPRKLWKNNGLAESVFFNMEKKTPEAYCALICGMAKHGQAEGAWEFYNQMLAEGFNPDLPTYNAIFRVSGFVREDGESKVQMIHETLKNMIHSGIKPNTLTLNAILETISRIPIYRMAREKALQMLADFKTIGVKPSLASYYFLLKIFCREKGPVNNILIDIVNHLEMEMPAVQDLQDTFFFAEAMRVCNQHLEDLSLAQRLHNLLCTPPNQVLIGDSFKESNFYRNFVLLATRAETPEGLMKMYRHLVPNIYTPEQSVFEAIIKSLLECSAVQYIPELWSDALYMEMADRESIIEMLLQALASGSGPAAETTLEAEEVDPVLATAKAIIAHVDAVIQFSEEQDRQISLRWTGSMLGNLTKIFLQYGDFASAKNVMIKVNSLKNLLSSFIPISTLNQFMDKCIEQNDSAMALLAVDYAVEMGYNEAPVFGQQIVDKLKLDAKQQEKLNNILRNVSPSLSAS